MAAASSWRHLRQQLEIQHVFWFLAVPGLNICLDYIGTKNGWGLLDLLKVLVTALLVAHGATACWKVHVQ